MNKIKGLYIARDFITEEEHNKVVKFIYEQDNWKFGDWEQKVMEYKCRDDGVPIGLQRVVMEMGKYDKVIENPNHVTLDECTPGQGIEPRGGEDVCILTLGSEYVINFVCEEKEKEEHLRLVVPRRSLLTIAEDAANKWSHVVSRCVKEEKPDNLGTLIRGTFICVTFKRSCHTLC